VPVRAGKLDLQCQFCRRASVPIWTSRLSGARFRRCMDRHPSLRTTFAVHAGKPVQQIHEHQPVHFEETDASTWREDELQTRLVEETQRPFDLERGPVMRVSLFTRSAQEHILLLVIHHIVVDFWSLAVILNELGVLYLAEKAGRPASLPPLDLQYTDFVVGRPKCWRVRPANGSGTTGKTIGRPVACAQSADRPAATADSDVSWRAARFHSER
jgi:hypothetical protein